MKIESKIRVRQVGNGGMMLYLNRVIRDIMKYHYGEKLKAEIDTENERLIITRDKDE